MLGAVQGMVHVKTWVREERPVAKGSGRMPSKLGGMPSGGRGRANGRQCINDIYKTQNASRRARGEKVQRATKGGKALCMHAETRDKGEKRRESAVLMCEAKSPANTHPHWERGKREQCQTGMRLSSRATHNVQT